MTNSKLHIAVIGSGVAGLTAAYILNRKYDITLYEKNDYIGGHTHTIMINRDADINVPVDTGFIVMNHRTYPLLTRLFEQLGVALRDSDMSFGYHCELTGLEYSSRGISSYFNSIKNIFNASYYRIFFDILRFHKNGLRDMETGWLKNIALGEYLRKNNYSNQFIVHHIIPMGSAVWSMPTDSMLEFPAESFIGFLNNHGLMSLSGAPKWRTVIGGSHEYVKKILKTLSGEVFTQRSVTSVKRKENSVAITTEHGETIEYNKVVIATHADEALQILADPSPDEKKLLGPWRYNNNRTILHTDDSVMPQNKKVWSSWNFTREKLGDRSSLCLTYHMNRLQGLGTEHQYFVTLNTRKELDKRKIILEMDHYHPQYSMESMTAQKDLPALNGHKNTYYCGSYFGYGFHEDAVRSSVVVANLLGLKL